MIEKKLLRKLVLESLQDSEINSFHVITAAVAKLVAKYNCFPTLEECLKAEIDYHSYYGVKRLNPIDELTINEIIWDLIIERILTLGLDLTNAQYPWLRLTEYGKGIIIGVQEPAYYDPEGFCNYIEQEIAVLDPVIKQYTLEGLNCFRQRLFFAAAVMIGAAAESAIILLLESMAKFETDEKKQKNYSRLLEQPSLPQIFTAIQSFLDEKIKAKTIPYSVHQGCSAHLISLFEMIRVQRNDAVHPAAGQVSQEKVYLSIQTLPAAFVAVYRVLNWLNEK